MLPHDRADLVTELQLRRSPVIAIEWAEFHEV